jgi:hypothetical protein
MIRFDFITGEDEVFYYGKTYILWNRKTMEDWDCEFITEWMQTKDAEIYKNKS